MMDRLDLDAELAALPDLTWSELRSRWAQVTGRPVPRVKHTLLRLALAWELQASVYGGLSRRTEQRLAQISGDEQDGGTAPGMKLVREWGGVLHTVTVSQDEAVHWDGKQWNSLSEVARAITGTRWSGPAFFGLKKKTAA